MSKTLHLPLKKEWYKMIESGVKTEEYRDLSEYWISRLTRYGDDEKLNGRLYANFLSTSLNVLKLNIEAGIVKFTDFDAIKFSYGYTKRTMTFECNGITIGKGRSVWGAPDNDVFIIKLGRRIE